MASPQLEDGYTRISNELMEALARFRMPGHVRQILDVIFRKTYGYQKKKDNISLSQFCLSTGIDRANCARAIRAAVSLNLIVKNDTTTPSEYKINKDYTTWKQVSKMTLPTKRVSKMTLRGSVKSDKRVVSKMTHTKEIITKENNTKENTIVADRKKQQEFIKKYCDSFKALYGANPIITGKHAGIVRRLIKIDKIEDIMEKFFKSTDPFVRKCKHDLSVVESQINRLIVAGGTSGIDEWVKEMEGGKDAHP